MLKVITFVIQCLVIVYLFGIPFMPLAQSYSSELDLNKRYHTTIKNFWHTGHFESFQGVDDTRINYARFTHINHHKNIVIVPGRSEGYLKYQELTAELFEQGYDIYIIDHRGQGISQRLTKNPHKGYVDSFDDYSTDLATFIQDVVTPSNKKTFLLAHSMGGAIASRYMQLHKNNIQAAVLASPMISINSGGMPPWLAHLLVEGGSALNALLSEQPWYFLNQQNHKNTPFEENSLSQSLTRYQLFTELYQQTPDLQLGGVTFHWLAEALSANVNIFNNIDKIMVPTLVLQAGSDRVVDNNAQDKFCLSLHTVQPNSCPDGKPYVVSGAFHELFFEQDQYRNQAMSATLSWFNQH